MEEKRNEPWPCGCTMIPIACLGARDIVRGIGRSWHMYSWASRQSCKGVWGQWVAAKYRYLRCFLIPKCRKLCFLPPPPGFLVHQTQPKRGMMSILQIEASLRKSCCENVLQISASRSFGLAMQLSMKT